MSSVCPRSKWDFLSKTQLEKTLNARPAGPAKNQIKQKEGLTLLFLSDIPYLNVFGLTLHAGRSNQMRSVFHAKLILLAHMFNHILNQ